MLLFCSSAGTLSKAKIERLEVVERMEVEKALV